MALTHAIILAGGEGKRLRPHTDRKPKPLVEVGGKPIMAYQLDQLKKARVKNLVIACSYKKEVLIEYLTGNGYGFDHISFSVEETPLGRGGGIKQAMKFLPADWEQVIVANGDNLWKFNIEAMVKKHQERNAIATVLLVKLKSPYGIVEVNDQDEIETFQEKPILPHWLNAGVYIFSREIEPLLPNIGDHEDQTFPKLPKERFIAFKSEGYWKAVDTVKDLEEAEKEVREIFSLSMG
ncbi:MAG: nucleotidyltransferase family protein [Candidatus Daviesbacteria bacterium]|nr:MAG: nucleotidyltransferase family protein [Candidatus Daviesbacteria bacterium]